MTQVAVDSTQGTDVILKSGLQPGQQVVTDGTEKLQDGSRVIPRPSPAMQAAWWTIRQPDNLAIGLPIGLVIAVLSARRGLSFGLWMSRVQR